MSSEDIFVHLKALTGEFNSKIKEAAHEVDKLGTKSHATGEKLAAVGKAAALGIGTAAVGIATVSVALATQFESAHARLRTAVTNTGHSFKQFQATVDEADKHGAKFGETATEIESALATMTVGMHSPTAALKNLELAEDLAAQTGKPLSETALAVTKAFNGQLRPIKQLGIDLPVAAGGAVKVQKAQEGLKKALEAAALVETKIHDGRLQGVSAQEAYAAATGKVQDAQAKLNTVQNTGSSILDALRERLGGSAAAQAETFGGKIKALKAQIEDWGIKIGLFLIPKIEKMITVVQDATKWLGKHKDVCTALAIVVGTILVAAIGAYTVSMIAAAVATIAATWPILAVIAAVAALTVAAVFMYEHWDSIWAKIKNSPAYPVVAILIAAVKNAISGVIVVAQWMKDNWPPIWAAISAAVQSAAAAMNSALAPVKSVLDGLNNAANTFLNLVGRIPGFGGGSNWNAPGNPGNPLGGHGAPAGHPALSPSDWNYPGNPGNPSGMRAAGGPVSAWKSYLVGEQGPEILRMGKTSGHVIANGGGGGVVFNVAINNPTGNGREIADQLYGALFNGHYKQQLRQVLGVA